MTKFLQDALKKQKKSTKRELLQITGTLGIPLDGARLVEVPNRKPYVYVKLRDNQNEVIQAYNNKVAASYGLPVIVERHGNRYTVVSVDTLRYQSDWTSFAPFLPRHGNTHSFDPETNGGADIVWVHSKQFMPSLIIPSGTLGGPDVVMSSYTLKNTDGSFKYVGNTGTPNLTPYKPVTGTQAVMVLVYLDTVSGNPYLMVGSGSYFAATITGTAGVLPYVPLDTNISHIPLAAVRMVTGTNAIGWSNIYDLRQFYYNLTGSSGGGGTVAIQDEGVGLGNADTLNFVGSPVSVTLAGSTARVFITGSAGGVSNLTGSSIGLPNKIALTNSSGFLTTDPSLAWGLSSGKGFLEWGANVAGKVFNGGYIGYQLYDNDFDIIGAGTGSGDRWVRIYDNLRVMTLAQLASAQIPSLPSMFTYLNATGTFVNARNAPGQSFVTGSDLFLGINGGNDASFLATISTIATATEFNANDIFRVNTASASTFSGTINGAPAGATVVYNAGFSGNENALVPASTSQLAKMHLHNTTRGNTALISNCNTATNTITLTANAPANWANGDTITIASDTVSGGTGNWVDLEVTSGPTGKSAIFMNFQWTDTGTVTSTTIARVHPTETFGTGKIFAVQAQVSNFVSTNMILVKMVDNVFTVSWIPSAAGTGNLTIREMGYLPPLV